MLKIVKRGENGTYQIVGTVAGTLIRESSRVNSKQHAEALRVKREAELLDEFTWGKRRTATFAEAVILYEQKGHSTRFAGLLTKHFGMRRMGDITDLDLVNFAALYYPSATPQTINRQVYTPMIAIWRCAQKAKLCGPHEFSRPKQPERDAVTFASDEDIAALLPACGPALKAAVLLLTFTGARASEVCRLEPADIDWAVHTVLYRKTKSGKPRLVPLTPMLLEALLPLRLIAGRLCGFRDRWWLNRALAAACNKAGQPVLTSHQIGRHAFAARLLRQGKTLKEVQEAGGWSAKSMPMVADIYAHLERSAVDSAIKGADGELSRLIGSKTATVIRLA